jgi:hypothetical protein
VFIIPIFALSIKFFFILNRISSIFFFLLLFVSITIPVLEQLQGKYFGELVEYQEGDTNEKNKTEKEEKETFSYLHDSAAKANFNDLENLKHLLFSKEHDLISENHASMPELPPEA